MLQVLHVFPERHGAARTPGHRVAAALPRRRSDRRPRRLRRPQSTGAGRQEGQSRRLVDASAAPLPGHAHVAGRQLRAAVEHVVLARGHTDDRRHIRPEEARPLWRRGAVHDQDLDRPEDRAVAGPEPVRRGHGLPRVIAARDPQLHRGGLLHGVDGPDPHHLPPAHRPPGARLPDRPQPHRHRARDASTGASEPHVPQAQRAA